MTRAGYVRAVFLLLSEQAHAETWCGFGVTGASQTHVEIAASPLPEVWADVTIHNMLAARAGAAATPCLLTLGGQTVAVYYVPEAQTLPDTFLIEPPEGYIAVPPRLVLPDNTSSVVQIVPLTDMPLG
jgi:hypothetical protein